jgi:hypothetical protein
MKTPWFDKANNIWIDKDEYDGNNNEAVAEVDAEIEAAKTALINTPPTTTFTEEEKSAFRAKISAEDEDMPF